MAVATTSERPGTQSATALVRTLIHAHQGHTETVVRRLCKLMEKDPALLDQVYPGREAAAWRFVRRVQAEMRRETWAAASTASAASDLSNKKPWTGPAPSLYVKLDNYVWPCGKRTLEMTRPDLETAIVDYRAEVDGLNKRIRFAQLLLEALPDDPSVTVGEVLDRARIWELQITAEMEQ